MASNLTQRLAFAAVAIPAALGIIWWGGWLLAFFLALVGCLGARELFDFAARQGIAPLRRTGLISAAAIPLIAYLGLSRSPDLLESSWQLTAVWLVVVLSLVLFRRSAGERPLAAAGVTILAVLYTSGLPAFLLAIRHLTYAERSWAGAWLVLTPLVITWTCDTAAMFVGRTVGGPKLWPAVSPGKTWSGTVGGVVAALAVVPVLNWAVLERLAVALPLGPGLAFALVLSIVGQVGDLVESLFKREVGVKDSSALIPGHGGALDRFDSLYFVLPVAAALYRWLGVV